ncbi:MAG: hypothetical protein HY758_06005 [Nitrospirae bacterium]|nr:hypothetical protein [Nitrospirota bacterium]
MSKMNTAKSIFTIFSIISIFTLSSCEQKTNPVSQYGDALITSYEKSRKTGEETNLKYIRDAVNAYHAANGEYPKTLKDIEGIMGSKVDPDLYQYAPETGEIKLKNP